MHAVIVFINGLINCLCYNNREQSSEKREHAEILTLNVWESSHPHRVLRRQRLKARGTRSFRDDYYL